MTEKKLTNNTQTISAKAISKDFPLPNGGGNFRVLNEIDLEVREKEIVALLGRSGSGKTTLLRIMAGLINPSEGKVINQGEKLKGRNPDVAMVFQNFVLLPWETVQQNVELGLIARGVPEEKRRELALKAIDLVGLDGFENAYPKELSGGMQQRVGFARALVIHPQVLFMDEPFSGLDVLTAENLRSEIADLWEKGQFPAGSILLVTHNIEEAVFLADRVVIMGANPGHVRGELTVTLPRPRDRNNKEFKMLVDYIYTVMTRPEISEINYPLHPGTLASPAEKYLSLPHVRTGGLSGLLELLEDAGGREDLPDLAEKLLLNADDLLNIVDAAVLLGFSEVKDGDVCLTENGRRFSQSDILESKKIFRESLIRNVPFARTIERALQEKKDKRMNAEFFLDILDERFPEEEAKRQFNTLVDWGRFAELFEYDTADGVLYIPLEIVDEED